MKTTLVLFFTFICVSIGIAQNKIGVNTSTPGSILSVNGSTSLGQNYSQLAAPTNGLIVEGAMGVGTSNPTVGIKSVLYFLRSVGA